MERAADTTQKESVVMQAVLAEQYRSIVARLESIYQELNGKGGIKECLTMMHQQHGSLVAMHDDLYGKDGLKSQLAVMQHQVEILKLRYISISCIGKWLAGIFSALIVLFIVWFVGEQWQTREAVRRLTVPPPISLPK